MFKSKKSPEWIIFCTYTVGITIVLLIGNLYVGTLMLLLLLIVIMTEVIFPIKKWRKAFPKFKVYTITGMSLISFACIFASIFNKADDYNELIYLFFIIWGFYLEQKIFNTS